MMLDVVTSAAVDARLGGALDVILPLGALEQHGPHLPLGTDTLIAGAIATRVADTVGELAVAPVLPIGSSGHHLGFAGTVSIDDATLSSVIRSTVTSLLDHGFRHAYVVTGHAGNCGAMRQAHDSLDPGLAGRSAVFADWPAQRAAVHEVSLRLGLDPDVVGTHGGHFETSIVLALAPEQVDIAAARPGFVGAPAESGSRLRAEGMAAVSPIGVIGDPAGATAEAGLAYLAALVDHVVDGLRRHRAERAVR